MASITEWFKKCSLEKLMKKNIIILKLQEKSDFNLMG